MVWLVALAVVLGALGVLVDARWRRPPGGISPTRIGLGLLVVLLTIATAAELIGVDVRPPPEQRGVGVVVDGLEAPPRGREFDRGLTLAMTAEVRTCAEPVRVRLTVAPTAEFWIDNREALQEDTTVRFAIPDELPADAPVDDALQELDAWLGADGLVPFVSARAAARTDANLRPSATKVKRATFVEVEVPDWGVGLQPLTIAFRADWTRHRSFLGGCYVSLPAVAGLPTVLATAQLMGLTANARSELPTDSVNIFVVQSEDAGLYAYYDETFEIRRGVTSLELVDHTLQEAASLPAPNANLAGAPAWTCRSSVPRSVGYGLERGDVASDVYASLDGLSGDGTMSFSGQRQAEILDQSTCSSFAAVESASAGTRRDLLMIGVGTLIGLGLELIFLGLRRRKVV